MKNYRYGEFRLGDYCMSWVGIVVLLAFSIAVIAMNLPFLYAIFPIVYALIWIWRILAPHYEMFCISGNTISVFRGKKTRTIILPPELTVVVSHVDICPPLTKRTPIGNQTHILKDKYAISILKGMQMDTAVEKLHRNYVQTYTTSTIQTAFDDYQFIYSFVCNQSLFDTLTNNGHCKIIIPESLLGKVSVDPSIMDVYIDMGC